MTQVQDKLTQHMDYNTDQMWGCPMYPLGLGGWWSTDGIAWAMVMDDGGAPLVLTSFCMVIILKVEVTHKRETGTYSHIVILHVQCRSENRFDNFDSCQNSNSLIYAGFRLCLHWERSRFT
jgi:hypothetical protein